MGGMLAEFRHGLATREARRFRRWHGYLRISDGRLERIRRRALIFSLDLDEVSRVEFYKVDQITVDCVCCDTHMQDSSAWTIDEDLDGWSEAIAWLDLLPGFLSTWRRRLIQPPFAENRTVAFVRRIGVH